VGDMHQISIATHWGVTIFGTLHKKGNDKKDTPITRDLATYIRKGTNEAQLDVKCQFTHGEAHDWTRIEHQREKQNTRYTPT